MANKDLVSIYDAEAPSEKILGTTDNTVIVTGVEIVDPSTYATAGEGRKQEPYLSVRALAPKRENREFIIKVLDVKAPVTPELIQQKGGLLKVKLKNLRATFYQPTGQSKMKPSYKADGLEVLP